MDDSDYAHCGPFPRFRRCGLAVCPGFHGKGQPEIVAEPTGQGGSGKVRMSEQNTGGTLVLGEGVTSEVQRG